MRKCWIIIIHVKPPPAKDKIKYNKKVGVHFLFLQPFQIKVTPFCYSCTPSFFLFFFSFFFFLTPPFYFLFPFLSITYYNTQQTTSLTLYNIKSTHFNNPILFLTLTHIQYTLFSFLYNCCSVKSQGKLHYNYKFFNPRKRLIVIRNRARRKRRKKR